MVSEPGPNRATPPAPIGKGVLSLVSSGGSQQANPPPPPLKRKGNALAWAVAVVVGLLAFLVWAAQNAGTSTVSSKDAASVYLVVPSRANCRGGPGTNNSVIAKLDRGNVVRVDERREGWSRDADRLCWLRDDLIRVR